MRGPPDPETRKAPRHREPDRKEPQPDDIAETAPDRQARILTERFAIGYCLAAELALIVWGACPR